MALMMQARDFQAEKMRDYIDSSEFVGKPESLMKRTLVEHRQFLLKEIEVLLTYLDAGLPGL